mmetsp:Transcript_17298/g.25780  ORF Transcript_17298/g.25780 Transcript_17298/m.25780 type:complete len:323 (+) Transcript_17298:120-1088(+)
MSDEESKQEIMADEESADEERSQYVHGTPSEHSTTAQTDVPVAEYADQNKVGDLKKSYEDEYARLNLRFDRALIEHKLALQYFEFRSFYLVFLPLTTIATLITIIGFLLSGTTQKDDGNGVETDPLLTGESKQIWSLVVGILGAISGLFNAIGKRANYQSQSDMYRSAVKALEKICLTIDFERDWFDRNARNIDLEEIDRNPAEYEKLTTSLGADLKSRQASFQAMLDACCDSPVPYQVVQTFTELDSYFSKNVVRRELGQLSYHEYDLKNYYNKVWNHYSTYRWWPMKSPPTMDVDKVSDEMKEWKRHLHNIPGAAIVHES